MELEEAKRRFEAILVEKGYAMSGHWTNKYHNQEREPVYSMAMKYLPHCRALLWQAGLSWQGMLSVRAGLYGEFPIAGDVISRGQNLIIPAFSRLSKRIEAIRFRVRGWDFEQVEDRANLAIIALATHFLQRGETLKAKRTLLIALKGDLLHASISEALSIVQEAICKTRTDRMRSAQVWWRVFRI